MKGVIKCIILLVVCTLFLCVSGYYNDGEKVRLTDVNTITLHQNRKTSGRRSSPVPQLNCIGGGARYDKYKPETVQCYNRGSDGRDVQWECKADMPADYKFGMIEVSCEGYEYPDDPYILKGSCGLEYKLEYTNAANKNKQHNYPNHNSHNEGASTMSWIVFFVIIGAVVLIIRNMTSNNDVDSNNRRRSPPPSAPPHHQSTPRGGGGNNPPPYGFKPEYSTDHNQPPPYESTTGSGYQDYSQTYGSSQTYTNPGTRTRTQNGGGFWTGMGLGSLAGYMFGNSRNRYGSRNTWYNNNRGWGNNANHGSSWGSGSGGSAWGSGTSFGSSSRSSGSRSTSGFGGTKRR